MHGRQRRFLRQGGFLAVILLLIFYVTGDAVRGTHGLVAKERLEAKISGLRKELAALKAQRVRLERDAELLGPKAATEPALLDEQARSLLDLASPADIVVVNGPQAER
jgi:cell division protein FtsB